MLVWVLVMYVIVLWWATIWCYPAFVGKVLHSGVLVRVLRLLKWLVLFARHMQVIIEANNMKIKCPNQLFINGEFVNSSWGQSYDTINPANESVRALVFGACPYLVVKLSAFLKKVICAVQSASKEDTDRAVRAAQVLLLSLPPPPPSLFSLSCLV